MKHRQTYLLLLACSLMLLMGCGKDKELEEYKANMETFYSDISEYDSIINSIDANSDTAVLELLSALDGLEERFTWMASLPIPEEFATVENLAKEAGEYMRSAVELYHQAYESETFDNASAETAKEYYDRANKRALYILAILHGEMPEELEESGNEDISEIPPQSKGTFQKHHITLREGVF